jgi:hypothetical protein
MASEAELAEAVQQQQSAGVLEQGLFLGAGKAEEEAQQVLAAGIQQPFYLAAGPTQDDIQFAVGPRRRFNAARPSSDSTYQAFKLNPMGTRWPKMLATRPATCRSSRSKRTWPASSSR